VYLTDEMLVWVGDIGKPVRLPPAKVNRFNTATVVANLVCSARPEKERHPMRKRGESRPDLHMVGQILILIFYRATRATKRRKRSETDEVDEGSSEEDFESDLEKVPPQTEDEEMSEGERSGEEKEEELGRGARGRANVRVSIHVVVQHEASD